MATILIVDDQASNRDLIATLIRYAGHTSLEAANGSLALTLVRSECPTLVICDLLMPVMDGYEFVRQLRAHASTADTQVIFYTATYLEGEARALANACGVQHLLFKPCEPEVILQTIALALGEKTPKETVQDVAGFDREHLRLLTDKLVRKVNELELSNSNLQAEVIERQRAVARLNESELRFRQIAENIREVFVLSDAKYERCYYVNPAYEDIFGLSCESLYTNPQSWIETVHADDQHLIKKFLLDSQSDISSEVEYRIVRSGGVHRYIRSRGFPIRNEAGLVYRIAGLSEDVTEQVHLRVELHEREAGLRRAHALAKLAHLITRPDGSFESWSDSLPGLIGMKPEQLKTGTRGWLNLVHPEDRERFSAVCLEAANPDSASTVDYRFLKGDSEWIYLRQEIESIRNETNMQGKRHWFSTLQDVSAQKIAEQKLYKLNRVYSMLSRINSLIVRSSHREQLLRDSCQMAVESGGYGLAWVGTLHEGLSEGVVLAQFGDDGTFAPLIRLTVALDTIYSARPASRTLQRLQPFVSNDVSTEPALADLADAMTARGLRSQACFPLIIGHKAVGVLTLCSKQLNAFDEQEIQLLAELTRNISFALDHIQKGERLNYLAYFDVLTGLPNSTLLIERLEQGIAKCASNENKLALVLLDIERFKSVNHVFGRQGGDTLLTQLADRLREKSDTTFFAARISADRYAFILEDITDSLEVVRLLDEQYALWFYAPFSIQENLIHASARMGAAMYPVDGVDTETLYRNAESALKNARNKNERVLFYDARMAEAVEERLALEEQLRLALERNEYVLHYQAKVDVDNGQLVGLEALIRWNSPDHGLVPPARFIPLLEETGLIVDVGLWVLRRAAGDHARWRAQGFAAPRIAVNVSALQLRRPDFVPQFAQVLAEQQAPYGIDIELTESLLMDDIQTNIEKLNELLTLDVHLSIDDFGTGYSSLAYLSKLPAEILKIDRAFIVTMLDDPNNMTLVSTMISMAHSLRMKVVAEGVETEEQAKMLRLLRCDQMQGYLIGKPIPFEAVKLSRI